MSERRCPCCGHAIDPDQIAVDLRTNTVSGPRGEVQIERLAARVVGVLAKSKGSVWPKQRLMGVLYADDPAGGPISDVIGALVYRARHGTYGRPGILSIGLDIKAAYGGGYFLQESA